MSIYPRFKYNAVGGGGWGKVGLPAGPATRPAFANHCLHTGSSFCNPHAEHTAESAPLHTVFSVASLETGEVTSPRPLQVTDIGDNKLHLEFDASVLVIPGVAALRGGCHGICWCLKER